jgi:hypothetical protein
MPPKPPIPVGIAAGPGIHQDDPGRSHDLQLPPAPGERCPRRPRHPCGDPPGPSHRHQEPADPPPGQEVLVHQEVREEAHARGEPHASLPGPPCGRRPALVPPAIMGSDIMAAPALLPLTTAPARHRSMSASIASVSTPSGRKKSRIRDCTPPVKKKPPHPEKIGRRLRIEGPPPGPPARVSARARAVPFAPHRSKRATAPTAPRPRGPRRRWGSRRGAPSPSRAPGSPGRPPRCRRTARRRSPRGPPGPGSAGSRGPPRRPAGASRRKRPRGRARGPRPRRREAAGREEARGGAGS